MSYLVDNYIVKKIGNRYPIHTIDDAKNSYDKYLQYLESIKNRLPLNVYNFAVNEWHYNTDDNRCLHDSWVESILISEQPTKNKTWERKLKIDLVLLGAQHDQNLCIQYEQVRNYTLAKNLDARKNSDIVAHGDWLIDEISIADDDFVLHHILFSNNAKWVIEFKDLSWKFVNID